MGLEDLINIYMYMISQTSTCLRAPRHTHAMTHTTTRQTYGAWQAIPVWQQDTGFRDRAGSVAGLGFCPGISRRTLRGRTQHAWCDLSVTGRWGSRHPRDHRDNKRQVRSGSVLSGSLLRQKRRVACPGLHRDTWASLSCWDRSPVSPHPWHRAWGIPGMSGSRAQDSVHMWSVPSWKLLSSERLGSGPALCPLGRPALNAKMVELKREFTSSPPDRARKTMSPEGFSLSLMVIGSLLWIPSLPPIEEVNLKILSLLNDSCIEQHLI